MGGAFFSYVHGVNFLDYIYFDKMSVEQKILSIMLDGKVRDISQIRQALKEVRPSGHYSFALRTLVRKGKLSRIKKGVYQMPEKWSENNATLRAV